MYPAHTVVLLLFCDICFAVQNALMSNLIALSRKRMEIRYSAPKTGEPVDPGRCILLKPDASGRQPSLYIDVYTNYSINFLRLRGSVPSRKSTQLQVYLEWVKYMDISFRKSAEIFPRPVLSGQVLRLTSRVKVKICLLEIFTCKPGKRGDLCDMDCQPGFFGLGCRQRCPCNNGEACDTFSGYCHSGCRGLSNKPEHCRENMVAAAMYDQTRLTTTTITSIIQGPTTDLMSAMFHATDSQCIKMFTSCKSRWLYLKLTLTGLITVYGVEVTVKKFDFPLPYSFSITAGGRLCHGETNHQKPISLGRHTFKCLRQNVTGRDVLIQLRTHNVSTFLNPDSVEVRLCNIHVLECKAGFYGPRCRQMCQCAIGITTCNRVTGSCPSEQCNSISRGLFCTSVDLTANRGVSRKYFELQRFTPMGEMYLSTTYFDHELNGCVGWLAVELDATYQVSSVTLTSPADSERTNITKQVSIFTEPNLIDSGLHTGLPTGLHSWQRRAWNGLPCMTLKLNRSTSQRTYHLTCFGLARTVFVVVLSNASHVNMSTYGLRVWACVDGTFGPKCGNRCNCENMTEVCDKVTGSCLSGCARGYKGLSCIKPCELNDPDPSCPSKSCHCLGANLGDCGPKVALCPSGCQQGYTGVSCLIPCSKGFYGHNCAFQCGNCSYDPSGLEDGTCLTTNGTCPLGCASPGVFPPKCKDTTEPEELPVDYIPNYPAQRESRMKQALEESSFRVIVGLIGVTIACTSVVIIVCCSLKCYWDRLANTRRLNEKRVDQIMRRAVQSRMDIKVQNQHQQFHEEYLKRDAIKNMGQSVDQPPEGRQSRLNSKAKAEAMRKMIVEMETQRRTKGKKNSKAQGDDGSPDDEEQDPNQKVAKWILNQDFHELIERRKKRLKEYTGNTLYMAESPYRISETSIIKDVHKLYDDVENLAIP